MDGGRTRDLTTGLSGVVSDVSSGARDPHLPVLLPRGRLDTLEEGSGNLGPEALTTGRASNPVSHLHLRVSGDPRLT